MNPTVPKLWPGALIAILAAGPSLTPASVDACRGRAKIIAIKNTIELAPWADVLYACDKKWWVHHPETQTVQLPKYGLEIVRGRPDVTVLRQAGKDGLSMDPAALCTGQNSGYQAINLAVHLGASTIVLLGFDMQPSADGRHRWHGWHRYRGHEVKTPPPYDQFLPHFRTLVAPLKQLGIRVINATPTSALDVFERRPLAEALA